MVECTAAGITYAIVISYVLIIFREFGRAFHYLLVYSHVQANETYWIRKFWNGQ